MSATGTQPGQRPKNRDCPIADICEPLILLQFLISSFNSSYEKQSQGGAVLASPTASIDTHARRVPVKPVNCRTRPGQSIGEIRYRSFHIGIIPTKFGRLDSLCHLHNFRSVSVTSGYNFFAYYSARAPPYSKS